jgi:hypothetical protein
MLWTGEFSIKGIRMVANRASPSAILFRILPWASNEIYRTRLTIQLHHLRRTDPCIRLEGRSWDIHGLSYDGFRT